MDIFHPSLKVNIKDNYFCMYCETIIYQSFQNPANIPNLYMYFIFLYLLCFHAQQNFSTSEVVGRSKSFYIN